MATLSIFLEVYQDAAPYKFLDRLICQWRKQEDEIRQLCGLESVAPYPGCWNPVREAVVIGRTAADDKNARRLLRNTVDKSVHSVMAENQEAAFGNKTIPKQIHLSKEDFREPDRTDEEWEEWIEELSRESRQMDEAASNDNVLLTEDERKLLAWETLSFHNYQFLIDCKTEVSDQNGVIVGVAVLLNVRGTIVLLSLFWYFYSASLLWSVHYQFARKRQSLACVEGSHSNPPTTVG